MKKLILILLFIPFVAFGQDDIKQGLVIDYYESGAVKSKGNYVDGKLQGNYIPYYENGELQSKVNYVDGIEQGEVIEYYENGEIKEIKNYKDGQLLSFSQESVFKNGVQITVPIEYKKTKINSNEIQQQFMTDDQKQQLLVSVLPPMPKEEITKQRVIEVLVQDRITKYEVFQPIKKLTSAENVYFAKATYNVENSPTIYALRVGFSLSNKTDVNDYHNFIVVTTLNFSKEKGTLDAINTLENIVDKN